MLACHKCGSVDIYAETKGTNTGLYCTDCGVWIKWATKEEIRVVERMNQIPKTSINIPMSPVKEPRKSIAFKSLSDITNDELIAELRRRLL